MICMRYESRTMRETFRVSTLVTTWITWKPKPFEPNLNMILVWAFRWCAKPWWVACLWDRERKRERKRVQLKIPEKLGVKIFTLVYNIQMRCSVNIIWSTCLTGICSFSGLSMQINHIKLANVKSNALFRANVHSLSMHVKSVHIEKMTRLLFVRYILYM